MTKHGSCHHYLTFGAVFVFKEHCSKVLYLEIVVKFFSQEHRRPPRIQEEKSGFDSRIPKSGCDLI